jgi:arsenate reductase
MTITVYHYPKCSTCRKARAFLDARGVAYEAIDLVERPPSRAKLEALWKRSGLPLRKLFNTSGVSYREGRFGERLATMTEAEALDALAQDGKLIKRPLVEGPGFVLVGFDEAAYARHL